MLYQPMRAWGIVLCAGLSGWATGQVHVDVPLQLTGPVEEQRVDGIAPPTAEGDLVTVGYAVSGAAHWGTATIAGTALTLTIDPPITTYRNGLLVRFLAPADLNGTLTLRTGDGNAVPLQRADGLGPRAGEIRLNTVCEAVFLDDRFILTAPAMRSCPPATLQVNDRFCIDIDDRGSLSFFQAVNYCAAQGGRLCAWDEYYVACNTLGAQLSGLYDDWEWVDDTSNHSQTLGQVGRTTCMTQRATNPAVNQIGSTRCCHPLP